MTTHKAYLGLSSVILITVIGAGFYFLLRVTPRQVCGSETTLDRIHGILTDNFFKGDDATFIAEAKLLFSVGLITLSSYDKSNGRVDCNAVISLHAPGYKGYEEDSGEFLFHVQPQANGKGNVFSVEWPEDTRRRLVTWLDLVRPPFTADEKDVPRHWHAVAGPLKSPGDCVITKIAGIQTRLEQTPGSGSAVTYANGIYGVSYDTVQELEQSLVGDPIRLCLLSVPKNCPSGDERGKVFSGTNIRTDGAWVLSDSAHMCGGA